MWQPRTFIVRLYPDGPDGSAGLVEDADSGKQSHFAGKDELWSLLTRPAPPKSTKAKRSRVGKTGKPAPRQE
jgi:hypothetical protein